MPLHALGSVFATAATVSAWVVLQADACCTALLCKGKAHCLMVICAQKKSNALIVRNIADTVQYIPVCHMSLEVDMYAWLESANCKAKRVRGLANAALAATAAGSEQDISSSLLHATPLAPQAPQ